MKHQSLITVDCLPTKENKLPLTICRKQMEVCHFRFLFAENKQKLPFCVSSLSFAEFRKQGRHHDMEMETRRHGNIETWTWTRRLEHGDMANGKQKKSPGDFP